VRRRRIGTDGQTGIIEMRKQTNAVADAEGDANRLAGEETSPRCARLRSATSALRMTRSRFGGKQQGNARRKNISRRVVIGHAMEGFGVRCAKSTGVEFSEISDSAITGSVNANVEPWPTCDSTQIGSTARRPVPSNSRWVFDRMILSRRNVCSCLYDSSDADCVWGHSY
jgi:hypothetical protein